MVCVCVFILVGPLLTLRSSSPKFINQREEKSSTSVLRNLADGLAEAEPAPSSIVPSATLAEAAHRPGSVCMRASSHGPLCQIYGSTSRMKWKFSASRSKGGSAGKRLDRMNKTNLMGSVMLGYLYACFANPERTRT